MYPGVERRVAQDKAQFGRGGVDAIATDHFAFQAVGSQRQAAGGHGEGIHVQQGHPALWVTAFERGPQYPGTAAKVQHVTTGQAVKMLQ
ncbi:hypothetical protein D3C79_542890 [compost metagenome]